MIETVKNADLKENKEKLIKNMKMLRHCVADMLGSKSFLKDINPGAQNGIIGIDGETFPVYITANTLAADGLPEITDDIYDEENYLSLVSDDDLMWYALVEHLGTKMENLWKENEELKDEKNQLKEELTAANNEINELEEDRKEVNKKCTEYVKEIDKLSIDNKRLSERVKTLVIEKTNRPDTAEKVSDPKDKYLDMDTLQLLTNITELENENEKLSERIQKLYQKVMHATYSAHGGEPEEEDMQQTTMAELTARINELEEKLKDKDECIDQLSKNNAALSTENKNFGDMLKNADRDARFYAREIDHLRQENDKIYSILNDAVKVVPIYYTNNNTTQNRDKQQQ